MTYSGLALWTLKKGQARWRLAKINTVCNIIGLHDSKLDRPSLDFCLSNISTTSLKRVYKLNYKREFDFIYLCNFHIAPIYPPQHWSKICLYRSE